MQYTWDPEKAALNLADHGVSFEEASSVLDAELTLFEPDIGHGDDDRINALGFSSAARVLFVVALEMSESGEELRIISAREADSDERQHYAEYLQQQLPPQGWEREEDE
jgi:uncharacterized DUF497 family protein